MDNWEILNKELNHFGIHLIDNKKCYVKTFNKKNYFSIIKLMKSINKQIDEQKKIFILLIKEMSSLLQNDCPSQNNSIIDERIIKLFIFSIKDMMKLFLCFDEEEVGGYYNVFKSAIEKDIKLYNKKQIYSIPDYKISIDWVHRNISKLKYIYKLLICVSLGKDRITKSIENSINNIKKVSIASGVQGPYSNLDLPMEERVFDLKENELDARSKAKQRQRRYKSGLENYDSGEFVGEGYYWRELRNEPFSWADRGTEDPYPTRRSLSNWG